MGLDGNRWNRLRYTVWAPVYDIVGQAFDGRRRESLRRLDVHPGERVLVVGCGTGADLPHLPDTCLVLATDLTPAMLRRARPRARPGWCLAVMDGQRLGVRPASADAVVLHLILAVVPDAAACLRESARALRPGGRMVVFDKFVPTRRPPLLLRAVNLVTNALFTDVTRNFQDILERSQAPLVIDSDSPALLGGLFRHIVLHRRDEAP